MPFDLRNLCNRLEAEIENGSLEQKHASARQPSNFNHTMIDSQSINSKQTRKKRRVKAVTKENSHRMLSNRLDIKKLEKRYLPSHHASSAKKDLELLESDEKDKQTEFLVDESSDSDFSVKLNRGPMGKSTKRRYTIDSGSESDSDEEDRPEKMSLREMLSDRTIDPGLLECQCPELGHSLASNNDAMIQASESSKASRRSQARLQLVVQKNTVVNNVNNVQVINQKASQVGTQVVSTTNNYYTIHQHHYHMSSTASHQTSHVAAQHPSSGPRPMSSNRFQTPEDLDAEISKHPESSNPSNHQWIIKLKEAFNSKCQGKWPVKRSKEFDEGLGNWAHRMRTKEQKAWKTSLLNIIDFR